MNIAYTVGRSESNTTVDVKICRWNFEENPAFPVDTF